MPVDDNRRQRRGDLARLPAGLERRLAVLLDHLERDDAAGPRRQHPARAVFGLPGREAGPGVGRRERLGGEQRRLVIAAAERGAIEQVEAAVVAGDREVVLALVPEDHRRGVEVGLVAGEPVLHLERDPIEGDDRVRVARRGGAAGGEPRAACRPAGRRWRRRRCRSVPSATPARPATLAPPVSHFATFFSGDSRSIAHTALGALPQPFEVLV